MALNPSRPTSKSERTRESIAKTAQGLFRGHGWNITRQLLADIVGISRATTVNHFPTLRSLVHYVYADQVTALLAAMTDATSAMDAARTSEARDATIIDFITAVANAVGRRPMLAMSLLPFMTDPWSSKNNKAPKVEMVTLDMLVRAFHTLLSAHWQQSHSDDPVEHAHKVAKQTILGMLADAANKRKSEDIALAAMHRLL